MAYFTSDFTKFFRDLSSNNVREWFHENKSRYNKSVKQPFQAFITDLINAVGEYEPGVDLPVKDCMFRIYRDIRFSPDKTPYKLHVGAVVSEKGRKDMQHPGIYVQLDAGGATIAGGSYKPDRSSLRKIRSAIVREPAKFNKIIEETEFKRVCGGLADGEKNKILPKEFKESGKEIPILYNKQFHYMKRYDDPQLAVRDDLLDFVMQHYVASRKLNGFLKDAIYHQA